MSIVLVSNSDTSRVGLQKLLESSGYNVVAVSESEKRNNASFDNTPDCIILDIDEDSDTCFNLLLELRLQDPLNKVPIVVLTVAGKPEQSAKALCLGASDVLSKPVDCNELFLRIRNTLLASKYLCQLDYVDNLTGLANRRCFLDRVGWMLPVLAHQNIKSAAFVIGVGSVSEVNEGLGQISGDELLIAISDRLKQTANAYSHHNPSGAPPFPACLARVGTDEFGLWLVTEAGAEGAECIARELLRALTDSFFIRGKEVLITVSIGIAVFPIRSTTTKSPLSFATTAMSQARIAGRNKLCVYTPDLDRKSPQKLELEGELRAAIKREEFFLAYQPKVDVRTGYIVGAETLVRWRHPERGTLPPSEFLLMVEDIELAGELGNWVLKRACAQNVAWRKAGFKDLQLGVNVFAYQLMNSDFVRNVRNALTESTLNPRNLTLEIAESVVVENAKNNIDVLHALKDLGLRLSVDDFDTGYSSLSYLEQFPLDELKVGQAFISQINSANAEAPIVSAIIAMARSLDFMVVAEGVETEQQLEFLREHECDQYQGFLFSKALPPEDFEMLLKQWQPPKYQTV
ncbi:MAG: EAL domain-containing protein [Rhodothermales bacterium]|nr:EAL domain-containing protein [Rhodothermales bacterium]